jgi:hypothetical protein
VDRYGQPLPVWSLVKLYVVFRTNFCRSIWARVWACLPVRLLAKLSVLLDQFHYQSSRDDIGINTGDAYPYGCPLKSL